MASSASITPVRASRPPPNTQNASQRPGASSVSPPLTRPGLPVQVPPRPSNPAESTAKPGSAAVTAEQLHEALHRRQLELVLVKREAQELKEEKAFLVAQNLRLERELCAHGRSASSGSTSCLNAEHRRPAELHRRPSFSRSRTHPNAADYQDCLPSLSLHSPTHSGSSSSSHPWPNSSTGPSTPGSRSPSHHSRNPSTASLAAVANHGPHNMSHRTLSTAANYPSDLTSCPHHVRLTNRLQKLAAHGPTTGSSALRPLSMTLGISEEWNKAIFRSNPSSASPSRRNSITGGGSSNGDAPPLKGILKPTAPIRPLSSCGNGRHEGAMRRASGLSYCVEGSYESVSRAPSRTHRLHPPPPIQRSRKGSLDIASGEREQARWWDRTYA